MLGPDSLQRNYLLGALSSASAEISIVGNDGLIGIAFANGGVQGRLQKLKVIRYARGKITVLDRPKLEGLCCECYAVVKRETDRLSPPLSGKPL